MRTLLTADDYLLEVKEYGSPVTLIKGTVTDSILELAASMTVRYSDAKHLSDVAVTVYKGSDKTTKRMVAQPAEDRVLDIHRIEKKEGKSPDHRRKEVLRRTSKTGNR